MIDNGPDLTELYRKHRPRKLKSIIGQEDACRLIAEKLKQKMVPHAIMLTGPSGTGKTTLAYVVATKLGCGKADFEEINAADSRGIDTMREINQKKMLNPIEGSCRVIVLDEAHRLTADAQASILKTLEQCPKHLYFILCTTDPGKLLDTIKNRCELKIQLKPLEDKHIEQLVKEVGEKEGANPPVSDILAKKIAENSDGSGRTALSLLSQALAFSTEEQRLKAVIRTDAAKKAFDLVELLMGWKNGKWQDVVEILKGIEGEEAEGVRRLVLATARNSLLKNGGNDRAYTIINVFYDNGIVLQAGKAGHAFLAARCWELVKK